MPSAIAAEFLDKLAELLRMQAFLRFGFTLSLLALRFFLEAFAQRFRSVLAMLFADLGDGIAVNVQPMRRFFHRFEVAQRIGVHAECDAQALAVDVGELR